MSISDSVMIPFMNASECFHAPSCKLSRPAFGRTGKEFWMVGDIVFRSLFGNKTASIPYQRWYDPTFQVNVTFSNIALSSEIGVLMIRI